MLILEVVQLQHSPYMNVTVCSDDKGCVLCGPIEESAPWMWTYSDCPKGTKGDSVKLTNTESTHVGVCEIKIMGRGWFSSFGLNMISSTVAWQTNCGKELVYLVYLRQISYFHIKLNIVVKISKFSTSGKLVNIRAKLWAIDQKFDLIFNMFQECCKVTHFCSSLHKNLFPRWEYNHVNQQFSINRSS